MVLKWQTSSIAVYLSGGEFFVLGSGGVHKEECWHSFGLGDVLRCYSLFLPVRLVQDGVSTYVHDHSQGMPVFLVLPSCTDKA